LPLCVERSGTWVQAPPISGRSNGAEYKLRLGFPPCSLPPAPFPLADIVVECTGNPEGFAIARQALRPRGTLVLKSTYAGNLSLDASSLVVDEITLIGSRCGPFPPALELLANAKVDVEPLINAHYPLSQGLSAFEEAQRRGVLKVLLDISP
ncbi:MAG TPA: zinc-binding dehydrogenase, partial [Leptolyngbyaceae cyanobacterium]